MYSKYVTDVAQDLTDGSFFEPLDVFACGTGLYAVMCLAGYKLTFNGVTLMEIIDLRGRKLGPLLKEYSFLPPEDILEDYCFIASSDQIAMDKAEERRQAGLDDHNGLASMNLQGNARTLEEIESSLGCPILQHPTAKNDLCVHKWGVIEYV